MVQMALQGWEGSCRMFEERANDLLGCLHEPLQVYFVCSGSAEVPHGAAVK